MPRADGPFEVVERIGPNAYKIDLPGDYGVHGTFNVGDLSPFYDEEHDVEIMKATDLRTNPLQEGEVDAGTKGKGLLQILSQVYPQKSIQKYQVSSVNKTREIQELMRARGFQIQFGLRKLEPQGLTLIAMDTWDCSEEITPGELGSKHNT